MSIEVILIYILGMWVVENNESVLYGSPWWLRLLITAIWPVATIALIALGAAIHTKEAIAWLRSKIRSKRDA